MEQLTKESLTRALEAFLIEEAQRPGPDGLIGSNSPDRGAAVKDLVEFLAARFGL